MKFKIQLVLEDEQGGNQVTDVLELEKSIDQGYCAGLSLQESKQLLKVLQQEIILHQAETYTYRHRICPCCYKRRKVKGYHTIQFKTLFGTIVIPSLRLHHCKCSTDTTRTFSLLNIWLREHTSPELQYIETKWGAYMSFDKAANLLADVLPVSPTHNGKTVRNHLHKIAKRQECELEGAPTTISGCANQWSKLPKPDKPIIVGIDGGYVRSWLNKQSNFEVIIGKSFSKTKAAKRFGLVQSFDKQPQRRLLHVLRSQGMQENQQITFLSDGADNVRDLQFIMYPESEHVLDWFHLTMRLTVLNQFTKGLIKTDAKAGNEIMNHLKSAKWFFWHGNVEKGLECLDECYSICDEEEIQYKNQQKLLKHLEELTTYVENNHHLIPNYGERRRYGEYIASSFVESTVNEVVTKRMVKKQQMQWSPKGAPYLLQARTAALNGDLPKHFERWYPGLSINKETVRQQKNYDKAV
jgi:hypothetical protein